MSDASSRQVESESTHPGRARSRKRSLSMNPSMRSSSGRSLPAIARYSSNWSGLGSTSKITAYIGASSLSAFGDLAQQTRDRERHLFAGQRSGGMIGKRQFVCLQLTSEIGGAHSRVGEKLGSGSRQYGSAGLQGVGAIGKAE